MESGGQIMSEEKKPADDTKKQSGGGLDDYLNSPRKKRKNYVCMAYSRFFSQEMASSIQNFMKAKHPSFALAYPRSPEELVRNFGKQIKLLIFDDEFCDINEGLDIVKLLKEKKKKNSVPILFVTARPKELIEKYNEILSAYHEGDEYIDYTRSSTAQVLNKIQAGLINQNRRRTRRYVVDIPVTYYSLTHNKEMKGRLVDFSLHGALLKTTDGEHLFGDLEQLKINLPIGGLNRSEYGDYLKVSAKVRRVKIAGDLAGVSFEYVSDKQLMVLTYFLTNMVNSQVEHQARLNRTRQKR
jgi:hypothetical protein